ncbi:MAG: dTDP-4-dehydrorhamnose 3,5-epimerase [Candidatus Hodarchaeota archaeon]
MVFIETKLKGAFIIETEKLEDKRGFFARTWCKREFQSHGLNPQLVQSNISFNKVQGTVRGLHYQTAPYAEAKLVRCTKGAIYDVIVDLRPSSSNYTKWVAVELTEGNYKMLYVPEGFAHGYQTLEENTEVFYHVSQFYHPDYERGLRWNDPALCIVWPIPVKVISEKDATFPLLDVNST